MKYMMIAATLMLSTISHAMEKEAPQKIQLRRGILIAIEGIDGSGKSTLAKRLYKTLKKEYAHVHLTREPGGTKFGESVRGLVTTQETPLDPIAEFSMFIAARAQHFSEVIIPRLKQNYIVISDRLADSSLAYQGYGRDLDKQMITSNNQWAMKNIKPDLTLFIKVPVKLALERIQKRNEAVSVFEKESFLEKVATGFETIYAQYLDSQIFKKDFCKDAQQVYLNSLDSPRRTILTQSAKKFNLTKIDPAEFKIFPAKHVKLITVDGTQSKREVANNTIAVVNAWIKLQ